MNIIRKTCINGGAMAVYESLRKMNAGKDCAFNGTLREFLEGEPELDETLQSAFQTISRTNPDARIVTSLKGPVKLDNISNRIIHYRDISKLAGNPVVYPYVVYDSDENGDRAILVVPYEPGGYLFARGCYYCMSEVGSDFYDSRNEIVEVCTEDPEVIVSTWERMKKDKAGMIQRRLDRAYFRNYEELKEKAIEASEDLKRRAAEELADLEDRAPVIAYYVVRWFLLKKLVYVQYMVNKNIRSSIHDGDIHRQRNQARLNSDDIPFLSYRQMWMLGSGEEEAEEAAAE